MATKSDLRLISDKARTVAIWSLILFVALPLLGLAILEGTFLRRSLYFAIDGNFSCPQNCKEEVGVLAHFWPANGLPDVSKTAYRYDGNLTYVPVWQPILWLLFGWSFDLCRVLFAANLWKLRFSPAVGPDPGSDVVDRSASSLRTGIFLLAGRDDLMGRYASSHGSRIQMSRSSSVIRMTGIASG